MSENDNLQNADGKQNDDSSEKILQPSEPLNVDHKNKATLNEQEAQQNSEESPVVDETESNDEAKESVVDASESSSNDAEDTPKKVKNHVDEIDEANAEDAEDTDNVDRHALEDKDYHSMSLEQLADEFEGLLKNKKVQTIKSHVDEIKSEFNAKFSEILEEKKEDFLADGGNEIDFYFTSPVKKRFNSLYNDYRKNLNAYYKALESNLKLNLENRLEIIEEIKGLINVEENINTTYKHFKDLQERWRNAGPIPRDKYNNAWNSYHHHVEIFYDFLHLNRDLRDMDFKHNLEQKLKIIERAEELAQDDNTNRAFRELQVLHKMWKEDLGPVDREHREDIWERFSNATKAIHDKRQAYFANIDQIHEENLVKKEEIIAKIDDIAKDDANSHQAWQKKIRKIEELRQDFFKAGKVPIKVNEETWSKFKTAVRTFNRKKNGFYKNLKKDQYDNLQKKLDLIKIAEDNKDSKDFETVTPLMKKIQADWKTIGHVPRKDSDKIWNRFKAACNHYFDQVHAERKAENQEQYDAFDKKNKLLDSLKDLKLSGNAEADVETIKSKIEEWKSLGQVPFNKRFIEGKFNKTLDNLFSSLKMDKSEVEMIKFENKLEHLAQPDDTRLLDNEHNFIRKKIDEAKSEINQLENNLQFFSNVDETNPLVKNVLKSIESHKENLAVWEEKLKKVKELYE
ncbi:DUF349 domain-containing protein [Subsaxibacter sp. CAU 1640]|uniref:DUF349 domain-containing protein n=1 Tax=Subsaxibacter sp. CAU 1640 TaxID=2933271 RepID=UPI002006AE5D|nr:DUF349 domain-containing protein [Subsaxibacter sp. CAU 1640]MCK7591733.1 DUF349 domain-containing protein [Subsaxibacter sp. CAU 1640]